MICCIRPEKGGEGNFLEEVTTELLSEEGVVWATKEKKTF